jgi:dipeptidyl aminopeptidase/acylaminoacyl peptidase
MASRTGLAALCASALLTASLAAGAQTAPPPATKPAGPRPVEDFARLPLLDEPQMSPDGKLVAGKYAVDDKQFLAVVPLDGSKPRLIASRKSDLNWWRWVNNDWLVFGFGQSVVVEAGNEWYVQRAGSVSADGTKVVQLGGNGLAQDGDDLIWVAHDGSPRILLAAQHSVYSNEIDFWPSVSEIDVSTGKTRVVVQPRAGVMTWIADGNGAVRMGIAHSEDFRETRVLYRPDAKASFKEIVRKRRGEDADYVLPALFLADPTKAIAYADDAEGYRGLYEYDLATLSLGKKLYASKGYDIGLITATHARNAIAGIDYVETAPRTEWIDPDLAKLQEEIAGQVKGGHVALRSYSDDHSRAVVLIASPDSPGAYFIYDRASTTLALLSYRNAAVKMARLHPVKTVTYKARDGLDIAAVLTLPRGKTATNLPLIVMPHGGPAVRDDESWDWWVQFLAERGYAVIQPNYRGSTGYGTKFQERGEGEWGLKMQDDLDDAVAWATKQGIADARRVCIVGGSYGGYAALRAAQRGGGIYRCAVSFAGVSDLGAMKRYDGRFLGSGARMDWLKKQAPDFRNVSPINFPEQFSIPVLIVHGKEDTTVPYSQSRSMADKLKDAGKDVTFVTQPLGDHHFTRGADRLEFLKALEAFLKKYDPVDAGAAAAP